MMYGLEQPTRGAPYHHHEVWLYYKNAIYCILQHGWHNSGRGGIGGELCVPLRDPPPHSVVRAIDDLWFFKYLRVSRDTKTTLHPLPSNPTGQWSNG